MKRIYVFLTDGFEDAEAIGTISIMRRVGMNVQMVSLMKNRFVKSSQGIEIGTDLLFNEADFVDMEALVMPGGPGTPGYLEHEGFVTLVRDFAARGGLIAATCAAPSILAKLGLLKGKRATCFPAPALEEVMMDNDVVHSKKIVEIDGNFITSRSPITTPWFALEIIRAIGGEEAAQACRANYLFDLIEGVQL